MITQYTQHTNTYHTGAAADYMAYQFKYDTIHGRWGGSLEVDGDDMIINGQRIKTTHGMFIFHLHL